MTFGEMFSSCNPKFFAFRHIHYPVVPSGGQCCTETVLPSSDHDCNETIAPSDDKDRGVTLETKVKIVNILVFPIVLYGAETWTMRKHERRKIDAFELWFWRRVLRVSWMERKTNMSIIENIKPEWTLESRVTKAALSYFGHVVRAGR